MSITQSNSRKKRFPHNRSLFIFGSVLLVCLVGGSAFFALAHSNAGIPTPSTKPGAVKATQALKPTATTQSKSAKPNPDFSFTAAGDYGQTSYTTANLNYIARSGVKFHLGLGDFDYDPNTSADAWSAYAKSHLPPNFPFEIVAGGHDIQIDTLAADFPDRIGNISGTYAKEYSFDYPPGAPLARFIIITPSQILPGYDYGIGSVHYNWVAQKIDEARAAHIEWVIVAMHQFCFVIDSTSCANQDLLDMLINKKVDLILQAQKHTYQASKQLSLNNTTCPTLPITSYNPNCVVNATKSLIKGAGSVIVVTGTGGTVPLLPIDSSDPKINYFRSWMGANVNQTFGVSQFTVTMSQITMKFVPLSGGNFTDNFTIESVSQSIAHP
ncbi:MAG TPA: hypothetical protein VKR83_00495 [Ktedonobacteraceae bacterium]|nr:hypothetical protein [Ktedonobacteraceae bacterium]